MIRPAVIALALFASAAAVGGERTLDRTFTVQPGGTLIVDADAASVRVTGGNGNQVTVHMNFRGSEEHLAKMTLDAVAKDGGVTVTMRRQGRQSWFNWGGWNSGGFIEIRIPKHYEVNVRTGGGDVELRDAAGTARLRTSGGNVVARNLEGSIELRTSGGTIEADDIRGDVDADTSGGDVRLTKVDGKIDAHTSGGSVRCSLAGSNRGISASTSGGDVELILPRGTAGNVEATTSGGNVRSELPLSPMVQKEGRLEGALNGGGPPIDAHTSGGNISLRAG